VFCKFAILVITTYCIHVGFEHYHQNIRMFISHMFLFCVYNTDYTITDYIMKDYFHIVCDIIVIDTVLDY